MKKMFILIGFMMILMLPSNSYAAVQSSYPDTRTTWLGGVVGEKSGKVEKMTLSEVTAKAIEEAGIYGRPVQYKTEDAKMVYQAFPDYGKSKCRFVHGKTWEESKLIRAEIKEVCRRDYDKDFVPYYGEILRSVPR